MQGLQLELGLVRHKPPLAGEERDLKKKRSLPSWKPPPRNKNTGVEKRVASLLIINKVKGLKTICTFIFSTKVNWCHGDWTSYISRSHIIKFSIGKGFYVIFFFNSLICKWSKYLKCICKSFQIQWTVSLIL